MIHILLFIAFFGSSFRPVVRDIGKGDVSNFSSLCQYGTRSHMQMIVKLATFGKYRIALVKDWIFGRPNVNSKEAHYGINVDGRKFAFSGLPYFTGMYTYSPTYIVIYKKEVEWDYIKSSGCNKPFILKYPGSGLSLISTNAEDSLKPSNILSVNGETVEISPLLTADRYTVFLLRAVALKDSIKTVIAKDGRLKENMFLKAGKVYLGIMDNASYDIQIGSLDLNLPEALELLGNE